MEKTEEAIDPYKEYSVATPDEINQDLDAAVRKASGLPPPEKLWPFGYNAEEVVTVYGSLRTYLKILAQQPEEDLETIARVTRLMIAIKPQAVEASQEIAERAK